MKSINIIYPIVDDPETNKLFKTSQTTKDALVSDLLLLLTTEKGQRLYYSDFGTNIRKFLFEPKDEETFNLIIADIKDTVKRYIPQLTVTNVQIFQDNDITGTVIPENQIIIRIRFTFADDTFQEESEVVLTY